MVRCRVVTGKQTLLIGAYPPTSTLEHLPDLAEALTHFRDQNIIVLGDLNTDTQSYNPLSQQVAELLMEFGLVDLQHHIISSGCSDTGNVVADAEREIVGEKMGRHLWEKGTLLRHGANKGREEASRALLLEG